MIKKILITISFIILFMQVTFAQEVFKVTSVNFDTSNSLIFLTSPDNVTESIMKNVMLIRLQNPKRIYFDINSAVLTVAPQDWFLNTGGINHVKVHQFSTNPNKIRVVLYLDEDFNPSNISCLKVNNNIVIKFKDRMCKEDYFQNTYRDEKHSSSDFYESLSISSEDLNKIKPVLNNSSNDIVLNQIQQAFAVQTSPKSDLKLISVKTDESIKKELKLKSKYYLNLISPKSNGFLVSGFGAAAIEKPMYLTNPARVVFDIPNAVASTQAKNQEYRIGQDTVKIGQFEPNKVRIVITSNQLEKYFPIFLADGQSIYFSNTENLDLDSLFNKTADATAYYVQNKSPAVNEFIMAFNSPIVHSIRRDNSKLTINLYNALRYNDKNFRNAVQNSCLNEMKIDLIPQIGLKITLPLEKGSIVDCYLGADGKSIKVVVRGIKPKIPVCSQQNIVLPKCKKEGLVVVIDPGHGGSDYGAIRDGINEKDINMDIARRVQSMLESKGVKTYMTRDKDETVSLESRTIYNTTINPNLFVSVHVNSSLKPEISGIETHYYKQNSLELAQTVHASLISYVKSPDRGLFKSRFYVINHTEIPAILVEVGFMSNDTERAELITEQRKQQTAKAIADGVLRYLNK